jgi:hypothetical protein
MKPMIKRILWTATVLIAVFYGGAIGWLKWNETDLVFHPNFPSRGVKAPPQDLHLVYTRIELKTRDGVPLVGWIIPAKDSSALWVIFLHGNAGNISDRAKRYDQFRQCGLNTLALDYPGFGASEGRPSENGCYQTADACYDYLTQVRGIPARHIVIYGHSLGAGVAIDLASRVEAAAVIAEGAMTSVPDRGKELYPFLPIKLAAAIQFASIEKIDRIKYPKLIIHAVDDEVIPIQHGRNLFEKATEPKIFLEVRGGHNLAYAKDRENFERGLKAFLLPLRH